MNCKQQSFVGTIKQDLSLSMNDYSQISNIQKHNNNVFLMQKIQLLELELEQYKCKELQNKKLNQSIINTYNKVQHDFRDKQSSNFNISQMMLKHKQQMRKIKNQWHKQKIIIQNQLKSQRQKKNKLQIQVSQLRVQKQKCLFEQKIELQDEFNKKLAQATEELMTKIQLIEQSNQQNKRLAGIYKQHLYLRNMNNKKQNIAFLENQTQINRFSQNKGQNNHNIERKSTHIFNNKLEYEVQQYAKQPILKYKNKSISTLNKKVNHALRQIHADRKKQLRKPFN